MEILEGLWDIKLRYKGVPTRALFISAPSWEGNKKSYRSTLSRMRHKGLINKKDGHWSITHLGEKYLKENKNLRNFGSTLKPASPKNLLLMFDIPEEKRAKRRWFRLHLKKFHYKMVQKSVWVGPSPLPQEFISYLKEIKLTSCIKTFKLSRVK
jgi:DNA-binding transcriptional regulator PaaX